MNRQRDRKDETERSERLDRERSEGSDRQIRSDGWMYALVFEDGSGNSMMMTIMIPILLEICR